MVFRDIIGQEKAVNILIRTIERGRVPSTYLFAGESGIGKKFTAINFAKTLNCLKDRKALSVMRNEMKDKNSSRPTTDKDNMPGSGGFWAPEGARPGRLSGSRSIA